MKPPIHHTNEKEQTMKIKRILCGLLAVIMLASLLSLAACGDDPDKDGDRTGGGNNNGHTSISNPWWKTTGSLDKNGDAVVFDDITIELTTVVCGEDLGPFNQLIAQFNAAYSGRINVQVTSVVGEGFEQTVAQRIANNSNPPDLIMSHQKGHMSFADNKLIQPFDEAMEASGILLSSTDYAQGLVQYSSLGFDGYTFGVPVDAQSEVVYYNKQLLNKYGGELPTTRSELIALCDRVAKGEGITPIAWSTGTTFFADYVFTTAIVQNGGHLFDSNNRADWYDNAANRKAFTDGIQSIREFTTHSPQLAAYNVSESAALNSFISNQALFYVAMPWDCSSILNAYGQANGNLSEQAVMNDRVGASSLANWFALNDSSSNANKIFGDSHFFAMSKSVTNITKKAAICEFIRWFTQTGSVGAKWAEAGHVTASTIILNDSDYTNNAFVKEYLNNFYPDINAFVCSGNNPYIEDITSALRALFDSTQGNTGTSADENSIRAAQDSANSFIDFMG